VDAYRSSAFRCPVCANASLREFHGRLVCDECQGMQLATDDFAESIREIDGSTDAIAITDVGAARGTCPQCSQPMVECKLALGSLSIEHLMRCATHGLWIPRDAMTAAYARASRRGGFRGMGATGAAPSRIGGGRAGGSEAASFIANMPSAHSGMSGPMAGIARAFGAGSPASSGLAISKWQHARPRAHTLFVSAHKNLPLACPACQVPLDYQGDRWACATCRGLFVENEALVALIREMALSPWELPAGAGKPGERACPICKTPLVVERLEGATIDRCDLHGVWFDEHELEQALHHAGTPSSGLGAWLKRLFGRRS
jgi:Zn-finger nucleic acid-binding protein